MLVTFVFFDIFKVCLSYCVILNKMLLICYNIMLFYTERPVEYGMYVTYFNMWSGITPPILISAHHPNDFSLIDSDPLQCKAHVL